VHEEIRGDCVNGLLEVKFLLIIQEVTADTLVIGDIRTGDFSGGAEATISVYYPDEENPAAWQTGDTADSLVRTYSHFYAPGTYTNVRFDFAPISGLSNCADVDVLDPKSEKVAELEIPPCGDEPGPLCPDIAWDPPQGSETCDADGQWTLAVQAVVASTEVGGELFWIDTDDVAHSIADQSSSVVGTTRVLAATHRFPPGPYRLRAVTSCSSATTSGELPSCPVQCPKVVISQPLYGTTCDQGRRPVILTATLAMGPGQVVPLHAQLVDEEGTVLDDVAATANSLTLSATALYAGGPHWFEVRVLAPDGCDDPAGRSRIEVEVPACPPPPRCPDVVIAELSAAPAANCLNSCTVDMLARVVLPPGFDREATIELGDELGVFDTTTATSGVVERSFSRIYTGGTHVFRALVSAPPDCTYEDETSFQIPVGQVTPPWWPDWLPTPPAWLCIAWFIFNIVLLIVTGILIFVTACFFQWWLLAITIAVAVFTFLSVILNVLFCAWVDNVCPCLRWLPRIIAALGVIFGLIALAVAIVEAIVTSEAGTFPAWPCFLGAVIEFAYFEFLALVTWEILFFFGCDPFNFRDLTRLIPRRR
jgi:hypothetical protein